MKIVASTTRFFRLGAANRLLGVAAGNSAAETNGSSKFRSISTTTRSFSTLSRLRFTGTGEPTRVHSVLNSTSSHAEQTGRGCGDFFRRYSSSSTAASGGESKGPVLYASSHEYVRGEVKDGAVVDLGISCHAADEIGELVFVELPDVGKEFASGDAVVTLESVKSVAEVYCPFAKAEVVELNEELRDNPKLTNEDAEGKGWIVRLRVKGEPGDGVGKLMSKEKYEEFLKSQDGGGH